MKHFSKDLLNLCCLLTRFRGIPIDIFDWYPTSSVYGPVSKILVECPVLTCLLDMYISMKVFPKNVE